MVRPFLPLAFGFALGVFLQESLSLTFALLLALTFLFSAIACFCYFKKSYLLSYGFLILVFIPLGGIHLENEMVVLPSHHIKSLEAKGETESGKKAEIVFMPVDNPTMFRKGARIMVELVGIYQWGEKRRVCGKLYCYVQLPNGIKTEKSLPRVGDECRVVTDITPIGRRYNGLSKWYDHRYRSGVTHVINIPSPDAIEIVNPYNKLDLVNLSRNMKSVLSSGVDKYVGDATAAALIKAITLGVRSEEFYELGYDLRMSGIMHITAVSGLHVAVLIISVLFISKLLNVPFRKRHLYALIIVIFFCFAVGSYPSVMRASIMGALYLIGRLLSRDIDFLNIMGLAMLLVLLNNPREFFAPGFHFTFFITVCVYFALKSLRVQNLSSWKRYLLELSTVSFVAFLASFPFSAYHFNQVTLVSVLINIVVAPFLFILMNAAILFYLFLVFHLVPPSFLSDTLSFLAGLIETVASAASSVHLLSYRVPTPSLFIVVVYATALLILLFMVKKRMWKVEIVAALIVMITGVVVALYPFSPFSPDGLEVNFLDTGQSESILIETPEGEKILLDGGGGFTNPEFVGEKIVSRFLWNRGIKRLDIMILSHGDYDHIGGLPAVARNFEVGQFWENGLNANAPLYKKLTSNLRGETEFVVLRKGFGFSFCGERLHVECLSPPAGENAKNVISNDDSLVLMLSYGKAKILFTGDAEKGVEERLIRQFSETLKADVLKVGHHGSVNASITPFLMRVKPAIAVICCGRNNKYGFPAAEVINRLLKSGIRVYRTDIGGLITLLIKNGKIKVRIINPT